MQSIYTLKGIVRNKYYRLKAVLWYSFFLKKMGKGCVIFKPLVITPDSIIMGDRVSIGNRARIEGVKQYQSKIFTPNIILNEGVTIQQNIHLTCAESVVIGRNTAIAANVSITDIHHPYDDINIPIEHQDIKTKPVFIGDDCKIYNNSVILQGTIIGKHCTIGANSVVSGQFGDYCVIAGIPAKVLKRYSFETQAWLKTDAKGNFLEI
ncbi:acyltransferase [Chryseobacterium turcicum]|uniref:Acyltransferase n=1 Tax=Chryseobacterium turcicum TaxID=2898076 RepID=A0A9Q3V372_9FLAO|nr:acyltransferase [Chryseobacterium turcicum]MCD1116495.1 acyltransferase [Chryseobacterium turcicum]